MKQRPLSADVGEVTEVRLQVSIVSVQKGEKKKNWGMKRDQIYRSSGLIPGLGAFCDAAAAGDTGGQQQPADEPLQLQLLQVRQSSIHSLNICTDVAG
ncbi:hypothetical protein F2P81_008464 [Scophthalmus maximus]|uniref:Uncharacterized protein n=1 Tax=Scophthalmus maximus TaxID=52904 RepID=A0A6A4T5M6_SCOMX|nr:hypothetical protein F2P81_008464 [Scophthalmus maximus]